MKASLVRWGVRLFAPKWSVGALAVLRDSRGRVLVLEHRWRAKPWGLPGGFVRWPETPLAGLLRELQEELGLVLREEDFALAATLQGETLPLLEIVYVHQPALSDAMVDSLRLQEAELLGAKWADAEELTRMEGLLARHRNVGLEWAALHPT